MHMQFIPGLFYLYDVWYLLAITQFDIPVWLKSKILLSCWHEVEWSFCSSCEFFHLHTLSIIFKFPLRILSSFNLYPVRQTEQQEVECRYKFKPWLWCDWEWRFNHPIYLWLNELAWMTFLGGYCDFRGECIRVRGDYKPIILFILVYAWSL